MVRRVVLVGMGNPRGVLLLAQQLTQGGSERQLAETAKALDRERFRPYTGVFRPGGLRVEELREKGVPVAEFPLRSFASVKALGRAWELGRYIRAQDIELVHAFDTPMNVFGVPVARAFGARVVLSSQRAYRELSAPAYRRLLRWTDRVADAIVVNCRALERHLVEDEGVPEGRIRLCYNGIDTELFHPAERRRPAMLDQAECVIGVICALRPEKSLPTLVKAFARLAQPALRLLIVGSGPELGELQRLAGELGVAGQCIFVPSTAEVADWLRAIDIFVLPSRSEALSNSLMEAMACGCAVVASRVGGNPELVEHGETGLLFEPLDVADLATQLELLLRESVVRRRMAEAGSRRIREQFRLAEAARRMGEIYSEFLERR